MEIWVFEAGASSFILVSERILCPIALFELGKELGCNSRVVIDTHPDYARRFDIVTQVNCYGAGITVHEKLADVVAAARRALEGQVL